MALRRNRIPQTRAAIIAAASRGVAKAGGFIVDLAQQLCPVDEGDLKSSIRLEPDEPAPLMFVKAGGVRGPKKFVDYAKFVEEGSKRETDANSVEFGTARNAAQPFLAPAVRAISVAKEVRAEIKKAVKR